MKKKACSVEPDFATCGSCVSLLLSFHTEKKVKRLIEYKKRNRTTILFRLYLLSTVPSLPRKFAHDYAVKFAPPVAEIRSKHSFEIRLTPVRAINSAYGGTSVICLIFR